MAESMLTTVDNPYNPFIQFDDWWAFDLQMGYNTCGYLERLVVLSDELSDEANDLIIEAAIDEIVALNPLGIFRKVTPETFDQIKEEQAKNAA